MYKDKISIIVPMYNVEEFIAETIESLLCQTYKNIEIILIDDASTDRTVEIASNYAIKHDNIMIINQPKNTGPAGTRNVGLRSAKGSYLTFVDSDDLLHQHAIEIMHEIASNNSADLVIGTHQVFSHINNISSLVTKYPINGSNTQRVTLNETPEIITNLFSWGKLYRRDLLQGIYFPENIRYLEDHPFAIDTFLKAKDIYATTLPIYYYRDRQSTNHSLTQSAFLDPLIPLQYTFAVFNIVHNSFINSEYGVKNTGFYLYVKRLVEGSIRYTFIGSLSQDEPFVQQQVIKLLTSWIETLDADFIIQTGSFQQVFVTPAEDYIKHINAETLLYYVKLLKVIKEKLQASSSEFNVVSWKEEKNRILDVMLKEIDTYLLKHSIVAETPYSICYPEINHLNMKNNYALVQFQFIQQNVTKLYETTLSKINNNWTITDLHLVKTLDQHTPAIRKTKPKVLLTYRNFSGCNTLALYKNIPNHVKENFEVEFVLGDTITEEYTKKITESDIIITTNMEYPFNKDDFNPKQIVIDLWHGFPLKTMFYADSNYYDKNSIAPLYKQLNYLMSYSPLYNDILHTCTRVNPNNFVITGAPRNDLLFLANSRELLLKILNKHDKGQKFIFYMPTFRSTTQKNRSNYTTNLFGFTSFELHTFNDFLQQNNYELIVKPHPLYGDDYHELLEGYSHMSLFPDEQLLTYHVDLYEVLGATDLLITDYSSIYFDYLLLDKPVIFTPTDLEEYKQDRGLLLTPYEDWTPGPIVFSQTDLEREILKSSMDTTYYAKERIQITDKIHTYQDGNSSERIWNFISSLYTTNNV